METVVRNMAPADAADAAIRRLCEGAGGEAFARDSYFDDDVHVAARRFVGGREWRETVPLFADRLPGQVVDIGAGRGIATYGFHSLGCTVTAVEPSGSGFLGRGAIRELMRDAGDSITVVDAYAERLPAPDASCDAVYCRQVLHHVSDLDAVCAEICRVLKPGGRFVAAREHVVDDAEGLEKFLQSHAVHRLIGGEGAYSSGRYVAAMRGAGFSRVSVLGSYESPVNYYPLERGDVIRKCARPLMPLLGYRRSLKLLDPSSAIGRLLLGLMARRLSARDETQGRLNTFVCVK